jgi:hypothetical protein
LVEEKDFATFVGFAKERNTKLLDPKPYSSSFRVGPPGIAHEVPMTRSMYPQTMNETSFVSH